MHKIRITSKNIDKTISYKGSANLSELLIDNGIFIDRPCSGKGTCGKCKVKFVSGAPDANKYDKNKLSKKEIQSGVRLSCKCKMENDAHIEAADKHNILSEKNKIGKKNKNKINYKDKSLVNFYGLAVDLGTTTIVVYLVNLKDGATIDTLSAINPQRKYGDNVITRSEYIHSNDDGLEVLKSAVVDKLNEMINSLCEKNIISSKNIARFVISGNTIMQHILLGVNPFQITVAPFIPVFTEQKIVSAKKLGIAIMPEAKCYIADSIAGYVGGDIVSGILYTKIHKKKKTQLLIDIGTNGEIVLSSNGKMYACSVAAGPAFEGEHITHGTGGVFGAVNKAKNIDGKLKISTIGHKDPIGICGSGLVDIVAYLLDEKILDETGALNESKCSTVNDEPAYYITDDIYISQRDIREIQLAKSAVAAGVEVLIQKAKIKYKDIDKVYLSGGFGSYLNVKSAVKIGLINKKLKSKCKSIGNSSGMGSIKSLLSDKALKSLPKIANKVQYIELSLDKTFNDLFIDNMMF
ncbi:MAG: ASKHA domain-containing protein [Eubacteriales bacterium]